LDDVAVAGSAGHQHGVNVCFAKEGHGDGNGGQDADLGGLLDLAFVAGGDILFNIMSERRPPKAV
jgi:hypothetical protein